MNNSLAAPTKTLLKLKKLDIKNINVCFIYPYKPMHYVPYKPFEPFQLAFNLSIDSFIPGVIENT